MSWRRGDLAYCSNVHPGADLAAVEANMAGPIAGVRRRRGLDLMACGLWLPADAARALAAEPGRLAGQLDRQGLVLITLNGFPYGDFHRTEVKEAVYTPAWDTQARLTYTVDLARILAACLPADQAEGTISTLPLGFGPSWDGRRQAQALDNLCTLARELDRIAGRYGRRIRVCLEPEPGCVLESTAQAVSLFTKDLPAAAMRNEVAPDVIDRHLGVCLDVCHQAVMFEEPAESYARLRTAGVAVGKIQISSALEIPRPSDPDAIDALRGFCEPRYLHQVRCVQDGVVSGVMDLPQAMEGPAALPRETPWRVHFHVPIQSEQMANGALATTRRAILGLLDGLAGTPGQHPHLEVETYTWMVLPPDRRPMSRPELEAGLAEEMGWLEHELSERGLLG